MATYEDYLRHLAPTWLQGTFGRALLGTFGRGVDAIVAGDKAAVKVRSPASAPADAIPGHGRERGIRRYPHETDESFAARVLGAWDTWRAAGTLAGVQGELRRAGFTDATVHPIGGPEPSWWASERPSDTWPDSVERVDKDWSQYVVRVAANPWGWELTRWNEWTWGAGTWGSTATREEADLVREICRKWAPARDRLMAIFARVSDGAGATTLRWSGELEINRR